MYPQPSPAEQSDFVLRLYFGVGPALVSCVGRAYLDLCRTVHGITPYKHAKKRATEFLLTQLERLRSTAHVTGAASFDAWHKGTCDGLIGCYSDAGYREFSVGQAQKWINMALKYVYVFGESKLDGFAPFYSLCHIPIDNVILGKLERAPTFACAWSRITSYDAYMGFQQWVRSAYPDSAPLAVEFWLWQDNSTAG